MSEGKARDESLQTLLRNVTDFDRIATTSLVNDYVLVQKTLKERNPFRDVTHYVAAALLRPPYTNLTAVQANLVHVLYKEVKKKH
jgi:hypothetical protein